MSNNHKIATRIPEKLLFPPFRLLSLVDYPPDCGENICHKHAFFHVLSVLSGEFKLWDKKGHEMVIRPGDFLVVPPEWPHSWRIEEGCRAFQICFMPFLMEDYGELFLLFGDIKSEWQMVHLGKEILNDMFEKIEMEFDSKKPAGSILIHSYLLELFSLALRKHCGDDTDMSAAGTNDRVVAGRALNYIRNHYRERIVVKDLARNSYLSESRFFQIFRKYTGTSPVKYICRLRMEKAKVLISSSHMSISQIADYLGYKSIHYFSRAYKKYYKVPPSKDYIS